MTEFGDNGDGITRRDFLDGVAITAAGLAAAAAAPHLSGAEALAASRGHGPRPLPPGYHPPTETGLKGQPDDVVRQIMKIDGPPNPRDVHSTDGGPGIHVRRVVDSDETYDCVIVGAGASGLAAAKYYRDRFGEDSRILLLDPLPDFGGHSHRNEFHVGPQTLIKNGGTVNLDTVTSWNQTTGGLQDIPGSYGQPSVDMLEYLGVDAFNFPSTSGPGIPSSYGLRAMVLFPARDWGGTDTLVPNRTGAQSWPDWLATTPWSPAAREGIARIQTDVTTDWIALKHGPKSIPEKKAILSRLTQKRYYMDYIGVPEQAIRQYQRNGHSLLGAGAQAVSAGDMWALGAPGFEGLGLNFDPFPGIGRTPQMGLQEGAEDSPSPTWPDGNSSLLRLLMNRLIPGAVSSPGGAALDQENVVNAVTDYSKLDRRANSVRIRLNSLVFRVKPGGTRHRHGDRRKRLAEVDYLIDGERHGRRVRATHVVMACWNRVTAHILDDLPRSQVKDLCYARKTPLIYGRAALNNWQAFADAKVASVSPRGNSLFWDSTSLQAGQRFGAAYGPTPNTPDQPAVLNFTVVPTDHDATPQLAAYEGGRRRLLQMSFRDLERALIDVIDRSVNRSGGDFEPQRDIHSIMINRWNYGYAHELTSVWDPSLYGPWTNQPQVKGRRPLRNVSIANSDSAAFAYTHSAINEGYRAVQDLPG
jgi:spermidine dehydrogenase